LTALAERIQKVFGDSLRWVPLREIARTALPAGGGPGPDHG
jgi:hypothetical protein